MKKKDLVLRCILLLVMNVIASIICVLYCQKSLILISKSLADVFYFLMVILFTIITALILCAHGRIRDLFGKDMKQTLINHGNITG
jgi:hypothetical protein